LERTFKDDSNGVKINIQLPERDEVKLAIHKNSFPEKFGFLEIEPLCTEPSIYAEQNPRTAVQLLSTVAALANRYINQSAYIFHTTGRPSRSTVGSQTV